LDDTDKLLEITKVLFQTLKNRSELMVDLAYSAILFNSKEIAEDVEEMEEEVDNLHVMFEESILKLATIVKNPERLHSLLRLGIATENIADAANEIATLTLRDVEVHPVFQQIISEADETIIRITIDKGSPLINKTIGETRIQDETGMRIIAIKKKADWIYGPNKDTKFEENDIIIARGAVEGAKLLIEMAAGEHSEDQNDKET